MCLKGLTHIPLNKIFAEYWYYLLWRFWRTWLRIHQGNPHILWRKATRPILDFWKMRGNYVLGHWGLGFWQIEHVLIIMPINSCKLTSTEELSRPDAKSGRDVLALITCCWLRWVFPQGPLFGFGVVDNIREIVLTDILHTTGTQDSTRSISATI